MPARLSVVHAGFSPDTTTIAAGRHFAKASAKPAASRSNSSFCSYGGSDHYQASALLLRHEGRHRHPSVEVDARAWVSAASAASIRRLRRFRFVRARL